MLGTVKLTLPLHVAWSKVNDVDQLEPEMVKTPPSSVTSLESPSFMS